MVRIEAVSTAQPVFTRRRSVWKDELCGQLVGDWAPVHKLDEGHHLLPDLLETRQDGEGVGEIEVGRYGMWMMCRLFRQIATWVTRPGVSA